MKIKVNKSEKSTKEEKKERKKEKTREKGVCGGNVLRASSCVVVVPRPLLTTW